MKKNTLDIMKLFLSNRKQNTELQRSQSELTDYLPCSIEQGSILSSLLYTIYMNEIPVMHKLLEDTERMQEKFKKLVTNNHSVKH